MGPEIRQLPWPPTRLAARRRAFASRRQSRGGRRGFTLIEAALAILIIGAGFTATLELLAVGTATNAASTELTTSIHLAGNVREAAMRTAYDDLWGLAGEYSPPVDARLQPVAAMVGWSQVVTVQYVDPDLLTTTVPDTQVEPTARVTVEVRRNGEAVHRVSWLAAASD